MIDIVTKKSRLFIFFFLLLHIRVYTMFDQEKAYTHIDSLSSTIRELRNFRSDQSETIQNMCPLEQDALTGLLTLLLKKRFSENKYHIKKAQKTIKIKQKKKRVIKPRRTKNTIHYYQDLIIKPGLDGRYHCNFKSFDGSTCTCSYTLFGSLKTHWKKKNHFPESQTYIQ